MLGLPYNRSDSINNLEESLKKFLISKGINDINDIITLKQARETALSSIEPCEAHMQNLLRYHCIMKSITPRLEEYDTEIHLNFTCSDGFLPKQKLSSHSFYFEWANTLWNMAANESTRGARVDRSTEEGIRIASRHFQQAAGILTYLKNDIVPNIHGGGLTAHSDEGLYMTIQLMLAQAQLCFYEKAIRDKKSGNNAITSSVIAKLAFQTALFYNEAAKTCNTGNLPKILDSSWKNHQDFQSKLFFAAAEYWQSINAKESVQLKGIGYGEEIARLKKAENYLMQALSIAENGKMTGSSTAGADILLRTVKTTKGTAENDNATIFLEAIPSDDTLAKISPVVMVKASGLPEHYDDGKVLFKDINSKAVQQIKASVQDQIDSAIRTATIDTSNATNEARVVLSSVGLPGSLESYKAGGYLPEALLTKISKAKSLCSITALENKSNELELAANRATVALNNINDVIQREINTDNNFRSRYPQWTGITSTDATADIIFHKDKMLEALLVAKKTDETSMTVFRDPSFLESAKLLSLSKEEIHSLLPKASAPPLIDFEEIGLSNSINIDTASLEQRLLEMAEIIGKRDNALKVLTNLSSQDITNNVMNDIRKGLDTKAIIEMYVSECNKNMEIISETLQRQGPLLQEILTDNEKFIQSRANDPITTETDTIIRNLEQSVSSSLNIYAQINAGITFYSNLQSKLVSLLQNAEDISYSQQLLRQDFENQIMHDFERTSQEEKDREYAQKLSEELQAATISSPPLASSDLTATYPAVPGPLKPQKPLPSNVFAGTPMASPPLPGIGQGNNIPQAYPNYPPLQQHDAHSPSLYSYPASPTPQRHYPPTQSQHQYPAQPPQYQYPTQQQPQYQYPTQSQPQYQYPTYPQHPATAYNNAPPPVSYQYGNTNTSPNNNNNMDIHQHNQVFHQKANRMADMGFPLHDCMNALSLNNGNEDAALNFLLTKPQHEYPPQRQQQALPQQQQVPQQQQQANNNNNNGLFNFWKK